MRLAVFLFFGFAICTGASVQAKLTAEQAATLPETELARLVLGSVGNLVIHVERPSWSFYDFSPHTGVPPLQLLSFDLKAEDRWSGGWSGMCQAKRVMVSFDASGEPKSLSSAVVSGTVGELKRMSSEQASLAAPCSKLNSLQGFFSTSNGPFDGDAILPAVQQISAYLSGPNSLPFSLTCKINKAVTPCKKGDWSVHLKDVDRISESDCAPRADGQKVGKIHCYEVTLSSAPRAVPGLNFRFQTISFIVSGVENAQPEIVRAQLGMGIRISDHS